MQLRSPGPVPAADIDRRKHRCGRIDPDVRALHASAARHTRGAVISDYHQARARRPEAAARRLIWRGGYVPGTPFAVTFLISSSTFSFRTTSIPDVTWPITAYLPSRFG